MSSDLLVVVIKILNILSMYVLHLTQSLYYINRSIGGFTGVSKTHNERSVRFDTQSN